MKTAGSDRVRGLRKVSNRLEIATEGNGKGPEDQQNHYEAMSKTR